MLLRVLADIIFFAIGYLICYVFFKSKLNRKSRECLSKKQMIRNRDKVIDKQRNEIKKIKNGIRTYEQIKEVYRIEKSIVNRDDKVKELIAKDN